MTAPGAQLAQGRTSIVLAYGSGSAVKVPRPGVPPHWARVEADITETVHQAGLPCPEVRGLVEVDGRESIVFERINGPSLWDLVLRQPDEMERWTTILVELQESIRRVEPLATLPRMEHRLVSKVLAADGLSDAERTEVTRLASDLAGGAVLCHGDLHPANILMSESGPVVIDWFDASVGAAEADVVRTSLLIRPPSHHRVVSAHLPGATNPVLAGLHHCYVKRAIPLLRSRTDGTAPRGNDDSSRTLARDLLAWERVLAAGRLAEHTTADRADLLAVLRSADRSGHRSVLADALGQLGLTDEA